jgi:hypothetical protein
LAEHWDGASWSVVPTQTAASRFTESSQFYGVAAIASSDVWAVGQSRSLNGTNWIPVAEHYDGTTWTVTPTPALPGTSSQFDAVAATGPDDVWAVGTSSDVGHYPLATTLVEHWDGHTWSVIASPNPGVYSDPCMASRPSRPTISGPSEPRRAAIPAR